MVYLKSGLILKLQSQLNSHNPSNKNVDIKFCAHDICILLSIYNNDGTWHIILRCMHANAKYRVNLPETSCVMELDGSIQIKLCPRQSYLGFHWTLKINILNGTIQFHNTWGFGEIFCNFSQSEGRIGSSSHVEFPKWNKYNKIKQHIY